MNKTKKLFKSGSLQKKMMTGSLACALLFGGAIPSALAEEAPAAPAVAQQQTGVLDLFVQKRLQSAVSEISSITGKDMTKMQQDLNSGQTIAQAAGMSANALLNSMLPAFSQYILESASSLLPGDQIAKLQEEGRQKLMEAINTSGYFTDNDAVAKVVADLTSKIDAVLKNSGYLSSDNNDPAGLQSVVAKRIKSIIDDAVDASDLTLTDVLINLELGSNLASATGMDASDLTIQLQQLVDEDIDNAASANGTAAAAVEEAKADAAKLVAKLVNENVWTSSEQG